MSRKTFLYDFNSNQWQQIQIDPFANVEIERVPICLVVNGNIEFGNPENSLIAPFEIDRDRFFASKSKNLLASCRWWIDSSESRPGSFRIAGNFVQNFGLLEFEAGNILVLNLRGREFFKKHLLIFFGVDNSEVGDRHL